MPKITIDGEEIEVPQGTTLLQAALSRGKEIPHYCYHPGLSIAGNCRMCLVEMEKAPKLVIGCGTYVQEGMVVRTQTEKVKEAQAAVMEFLLINHPLDCPICDQAGRVPLAGVRRRARYRGQPLCRAQAAQPQGRGHRRARHARPGALHSVQSLYPFLRRDHTDRRVGVLPARRARDDRHLARQALDNAYSGNVVDICPVGALTLKEFRFATRVWYIKNTPSICAGCARGVQYRHRSLWASKQELMTTVGQLDDRIKRVVPRVNEAVNGHWMCDEGRLSYQRVEDAARLRTAESPVGSRASIGTWPCKRGRRCVERVARRPGVSRRSSRRD